MCPTRLQFFFQDQMKGVSWCRRYEYPKSLAKLNLSYQVWSHRGFTFKREKNDIKQTFSPVLQKPTHIIYMNDFEAVYVN